MRVEADWQAIAGEEMRFFGNVSAAISHEINNRIAIINEKAGLLEDLAAMMAQGKEVDPQRFEVQSRKIVEQIKLARQNVQDLNRFAHSAEKQTATIDLGELLGFVAGLYARKAATAEALLVVSDSSESVTIKTNSFPLEALIGRGIDVSLSLVGEGRTLVASAESTGEGVRVKFDGLAGLTEPIEFPEAGQNVPALLEWLGARYRSAPNGTALFLEIPDHERSLNGRTT